MNKKFISHILSFLFGGLFSFILTLLTIFCIYSFTISSFEKGKLWGENVTEEKPSIEVQISLNEGATLTEVSHLLEEKGIIHNAFMYRLDCILKSRDSNFSAGVYTVNSDMSNSQINKALRSTVKPESLTVIVSEGMTLEELASSLENSGLVSAKEFIEISQKESFEFDFLKGIPQKENGLQGFLLPGTYEIPIGSNSKDIILIMLQEFERVYKVETQNSKELGISFYEQITLASIVEKEALDSDEKENIASLILNRLNADMTLDMPSTIGYIHNKSVTELADADFETVSSYNTYINKGLPSGPICNPSRESIHAAINPANTDYLYFVVKSGENGEHLFTNNYDEFTKVKAMHKQKY